VGTKTKRFKAGGCFTQGNKLAGLREDKPTSAL
jgi:hypothetical protein